MYDKLTPRLILILCTYPWGPLVRWAWPPDQPVDRGGGHVEDGAQSESSVGALVRSRPPIVPTVGDMGLGHPNCQSGLWAEAAQMTLSPHADVRLF
jgi:hypothetical protein